MSNQELQEIDFTQLTEEQRAIILARITAVQESYFGILPHPEHLDKYNNIIPNGAERIMAMAEKEQDETITMEQKRLTANIKLARWGQAIGALLTLALIAAGTWLTIEGHDVVGGTIFGGTIIGVASVFVLNKKKK